MKATIRSRALSTNQRSTLLKKVLPLIALLPAILGLPMAVYAQTYGSSSHTVTVNVASISVMRVSSGAVNLSITGAAAVAGQNQMSVVDQSTTLYWGVNTTPKKITAVSNLASPKYTLQLVALNPTQGTAAAQLTLDNTADDLVLNVGLTKGSCTLRYTGSALASQGTGSDSHTVTFTITTQ